MESGTIQHDPGFDLLFRPPGRRITIPRNEPATFRSALVATPCMIVAPRASDSLNIIPSNSLPRTCQVVEWIVIGGRPRGSA